MARAANVSHIFTRYMGDMETSQCVPGSWRLTLQALALFYIMWVFDEAKEDEAIIERN